MQRGDPESFPVLVRRVCLHTTHIRRMWRQIGANPESDGNVSEGRLGSLSIVRSGGVLVEVETPTSGRVAFGFD